MDQSLLRQEKNAMSTIPLLFRQAFFDKIFKNRHVSIIEEIFNQLGFEKHRIFSVPFFKLLDQLYLLLLEKYQCEYVYKNIITNELFLEKHDPEKSYITSEFPCADTKADLVIFNKTSTVYEIKTPLDSFEKLDRQIQQYSRMFDKIYLVTSDSNKHKALTILPDHVGILYLSKYMKIHTFRKALSNKNNVDPETIFSCLRKTEYLTAISMELGITLNEPSGLIWRKANSLFCKINPCTAHDLMVSMINNRNDYNKKSFIINSMPSSLSHLCIQLQGSKPYYKRVFECLNNPC